MLLPFLSQRPIAPWAAVSAYGRLVAHAVPAGIANANPVAAAVTATRRTTRAKLLVTVTPSGATSAGRRGGCTGAEPLRRVPPPDFVPCRPVVGKRLRLLSCRHPSRSR